MKLRAREGTWFAIPLKQGGFGTGLIASLKGYVMVAYLFGPRRLEPATASTVQRFDRSQALWVCMTSALPIKRGQWPIIVHDPAYRLEHWPLSDFVVHNPDQRSMIELRPQRPDGQPDLAYATLSGYQNVADKLDDLVSKRPVRLAPRKMTRRTPLAASAVLLPASRREKSEHAVLISFDPKSRAWLRPFEAALKSVLPATLGEVDGHEVASNGREGTFYLYGPSAAKIWRRIESLVRGSPFMQGASVRLRSGPPGARERKIVVK